jgi:hypothetical protein
MAVESLWGDLQRDNFGKSVRRRGAVEAASTPGMAGDARLIHAQKQRIAVAVDPQLHEALRLK